MNDTATAAKEKRAPTEYTLVKMDDGREVEFAGKRRMLKETLLGEDGSVSVRLDFVNGESRTFTLPSSLLMQFAGHGAEQKLGDEVAGLSDVEDAIMAIDELVERLNQGQWGVTRAAGNSMAGSSVLARALHEHTGKDMAAIKSFLSGKTQAEKVALRNNPAIAPIVAKLEAGKVKKGAVVVDTEALLGELA